MVQNKKHKIKEAAIRIDDGRIFTGKRHSDCFREIRQLVDFPPRNEEQGFITKEGRFVDRMEAMKIARLAGQVGSTITQDVLYSEDLY